MRTQCSFSRTTGPNHKKRFHDQILNYNENRLKVIKIYVEIYYHIFWNLSKIYRSLIFENNRIKSVIYWILINRKKLMVDINPFKAIGQGFFFLKFYAFICISYVLNFMKHSIEKIIYGNSKTVICPFEKTHPDVFLTIEQLIQFDGYKIQEYEFQTSDGAYISLWRIIHKTRQVSKDKYPILIMHGLLDCSISWFFHSEKKNCLPYMLAEQGYDVWVGNNRGTKHSLRNSDKKDYWEFNFDHFVQYDQPKLIQSVLEQSRAQKLIYIGHSQGSTQFLASTGVHPHLNEKIACFIGMGTVISLQNLDSHTVLNYLGKFKLVRVLRWLGFKTVLSLPRWVTRATGILIYNTNFYYGLFFGIVTMLCGKPIKNKIDPQRLGLIISHEPGGASIPNVEQWIQFHSSGKMAKFDYGKKKNLQKYGQEEVPEYCFKHISKYQFNSYIFKGQKDAVISQKDYKKIVDLMQPQKFKTIKVPDYAHLDYVWGVQAHKDIYIPILNILKQQNL